MVTSILTKFSFSRTYKLFRHKQLFKFGNEAAVMPHSLNLKLFEQYSWTIKKYIYIIMNNQFCTNTVSIPILKSRLHFQTKE